MTLDAGAVQAHLDRLTKPPGSLGTLEALARDLCLAQGTLEPVVQPRAHVVFAADHGVVDAGVSAWPREVTGLMIANIAGGGAACCALARSAGASLRLVDVGAASEPIAASEHVRVERVGAGTRDLSRGPAMTAEELERALEIGREEARRAVESGARVLSAGEMGIGNTTPASCLASLLAGLDPHEACGRGAGADDAALARKRAIVASATERARELFPVDPRAAIASVAGFEIGAMAGFYLEGAARGCTVLVDGMIATAAALVAQRLDASCTARMLGSHRSVEPAHGRMLEALGLRAYLEWELRLGEGTGALLLLPMLDAAAAMVREMATFEDAGIAEG